MNVPYRAAPSRFCARCEKELYPYSRSRDVAGHCTGCAMRVLAERRVAAAVAP